MKNSAFLKDNLKTIIPKITHPQIAQLEKFSESLREWNQRYNLISRKEVDHIWENHILPSLIPLTLLEFPKGCWLLDIGSGGGFPAIPLKIARPDLQMLLVDSVRKKTLFLQKIIFDLQLKNIAIKKERIESLNDPIFMGKFDIITARAVADISRLVEWGRSFLTRDGFLFLWKGWSDIRELERIAEDLEIRYVILSVPDSLKLLSPKFEDLRFFQIWLE
jgi:16S rRNA (guanine527-N7)-methyltransferase